ncbi:GNAT family N-acetyltransferase [Caballeronia sordidicola]|jgi:hypothetical protein|uniref:N-acetyltransferase domain-containing protein n=1 Tax=Caballeronia sordidicola TaxID=196367 RepID=A0A226X8G4_CABSO|nr:GNAT family N-acetyltransferase [Caballeronia sordidicola]OXC79751.1 hypothetical protein BSU04_05730 [Caballeronia sordidicola]
MRVLVFKDRCSRVIQIEFDDEGTCATAFHRNRQVGELRLDRDTYTNAIPATLLDLKIEPAYQRSGIAHTLLAFACREMGGPVSVDQDTCPSSPAFESLCRHLMLEGVLVPM